MKPGTKPKPAELKRLQGNPGGRKLPERAEPIFVSTDIPKPPAYLRQEGRELWQLIWRNCAHWLNPITDRGIILRYCEFIDERDAIREVIAHEGSVSRGYNDQPRPHPLFNRLGVIERQMTQLEDRLGLNPSERGRMGHTEVKTEGVLEKLIADRQNRR